MQKLKLGLLGLGRIGLIHYNNIRHNIAAAEIIMASEPVAPRMEGLLYGTADEVINHSGIDAVIICSPTNTHADYIEKCAIAGKHIFSEKPHDLSLERVLETLESVGNSGVKFMLGFNRRFDPNFLKIRNLVTEGKIGNPQLLKITSRDPSPPPLDYLKTSGGMFLDMSIHDFDMARYIMGKEVLEVFACGGVFTSNDVKIAGDLDTAVITLKFEDGTMGIIDNCRKAVYGYDQRLEIFGSGGMAKIDNNKPDNHIYYNDEGTHGSLPLNFFMERYTASYLKEMELFVASILNDGKIPVSGYDGLQAMLIALAASESIRKNRPVTLQEIRMNHGMTLKENTV